MQYHVTQVERNDCLLEFNGMMINGHSCIIWFKNNSTAPKISAVLIRVPVPNVVVHSRCTFSLRAPDNICLQWCILVGVIWLVWSTLLNAAS